MVAWLSYLYNNYPVPWMTVFDIALTLQPLLCLDAVLYIDG